MKGHPVFLFLLSVFYISCSHLPSIHSVDICPPLWSTIPLDLNGKMSIPCEAKCGHWFTSIGSMNSHLSKARSCAWYEKQTLRALGLDRDDVFHIPAPSPPHEENDSDWENFDPQQ